MLEQLESRIVSSGGVHLHYVVGGRGPTVLLLHGFPETHLSWSLQIPALIEAGFRVAALDLRGYGASDRPETGYDLDTLASDVSAVIDELGQERVRLVGHDWGGGITWHYATQRPFRVERAVVLDCPHPALMARALRTNRRQIRRSWYMFFFQLPLLPERWLSKNQGANLARMFRERPGPHEIVDAERRALLQPGAVRAALAYYRTAIRGGALDLALGRPLHYSKIPVPVTLIWGEQDSCLGLELIEHSQDFAADLVVKVIPDAGHFVHQERPEQVTPLLIEALRAQS